MSAAHTPGPWSIHPYSTPELTRIPAGEAHGSFQYASLGIGAGEKLLAEVRLQTNSAGGGYPQVECLDEMRANAALVSAAPDLLDALVRLVPADFADHPNDFADDWHQAVAAIAKATGA